MEDSQFCESTNPNHLQSESEDNWSENAHEPFLGNWPTETDKDSEVIVFSKKKLKKQRQKAKKLSPNQKKKPVILNSYLICEFSQKSAAKNTKTLIVLRWIPIGLYLSVFSDKRYVLVFVLFSAVIVAACMYIKFTQHIRKNTKVRNKDTQISIIFEEDGNISRTREIDTITRLPVPTQYISIASFKALPGPKENKF